jgi:hypothetical protein
MNPVEADLYRRICDFELDEPGASFPFSHKLAREYHWTSIYTFRAIQEYKKFIFLGMVADHIVSPPKSIDLVWHMHLIYTHSYWDKLCAEVLKQSFHHSPSAGGKGERIKYDRLYQQTLSTYRIYFGDPPADIWFKTSAQLPQQSYGNISNLIHLFRRKE